MKWFIEVLDNIYLEAQTEQNMQFGAVADICMDKK